MMLIFGGLSGPYQLAIFSIMARYYLVLTEQFLSSSPFRFLSLSLSLSHFNPRLHWFSPLKSFIFLSFFTKLKHYKSFSSSLAPFNRLKSFFFFKIWKISSWNPRISRTSFVHFDPNFLLFQPHFHPHSLSNLSNFVSTDSFSQLIYGGTTIKACSHQAHCSATF